MGLPSLHDVVPLEIAARLVRERAYGPDASGRPAEQLNGIAYSMAALVPVYTCADDAIRQLAAEEVLHGMFRGGGKELHFLDGRPPITSLAVRADAVEVAAEALTRASAPQRQRTGPRQERA